MVSRQATTEKIRDVKVYGWGVYTVIVTLADTITLGDFVTTETLKLGTLVKNTDGTVVTTTLLNNIVTVTGASTDTECTLFAFGVRL
jgi:hypothetical protein